MTNIRLSVYPKRKENRERKFGADRHFKLDTRDRFLMLLVYHRLYITYTLTGFLFDLDQSNVCRDIQKIESLIRQVCTYPTEDIWNNQRGLKHHRRSRTIFPRPYVFHRFHRTTDTKTCR